MRWRQFVGLGLIIYLPTAVSAADNSAAILRASGAGVSINDKAATNSSALFRDDLIRTEKNAAARLESSGSSVDINPETIVQFEGDELVLDHGSLSVNTSVGLKVRVGCLTVTPVNGSNWTQYVVEDVNGRMTVSGIKSDVYINERSKNPKEAKQSPGSGRTIVHETEQKSQEDKCGGAYTPQSAVPPGLGAWLDSPIAKISAGAAIAVLTCWALCKDDDPISPHTP